MTRRVTPSAQRHAQKHMSASADRVFVPKPRRTLAPDDARRGPHTPEHRAAIKAGQARASHAREQGRLAAEGLPHEFTPWSRPPKRTSDAEREKHESFGGCWACWRASLSGRTDVPHYTRGDEMTTGLSPGVKTCDDCRREYAGPAYYTFVGAECTTTTTLASERSGPGVGRVAPHLGCTENLCPTCAGPHLEPDKPGDPRKVKPDELDFSMCASDRADCPNGPHPVAWHR